MAFLARTVYQNLRRSLVSQITKRANVVHGLDSGKPEERLLVFGDASSPSVRVLPDDVFCFKIKPQARRSRGSDARRCIYGRAWAGTDTVPSSHAGCSRCRHRDEGRRHGRQRHNTAAPGDKLGYRHGPTRRRRPAELVEKPVDGKDVFMM
jgi:hypothetical protein